MAKILRSTWLDVQNVAQYVTYYPKYCAVREFNGQNIAHYVTYRPKYCLVRNLHRVSSCGQNIAQYVTYEAKYCWVRDLHRVRSCGQNIAQYVTNCPKHCAVRDLLSKILRSMWLTVQNIAQYVTYWPKHCAVRDLLSKTLLSTWLTIQNIAQYVTYCPKNCAVRDLLSKILRSAWLTGQNIAQHVTLNSEITAAVSVPKTMSPARVYQTNSLSGRALCFILTLFFSLFASHSLYLSHSSLTVFYFPRPLLKHSVRRSVRRHVSIERPLCKIMRLYLSDAHFTKRNIQARGAQIADARSGTFEYRKPNFDQWGPIFVGLQYGTCLLSPSRRLNIWGVC